VSVDNRVSSPRRRGSSHVALHGDQVGLEAVGFDPAVLGLTESRPRSHLHFQLRRICGGWRMTRKA